MSTGGASGIVPLNEAVASLTPAEREELQQGMAVPTGYDAETRAAREAFLEWAAARERDAEQRALEVPTGYDPETRAAREAFFRWLDERGTR